MRRIALWHSRRPALFRERMGYVKIGIVSVDLPPIFKLS